MAQKQRDWIRVDLDHIPEQDRKIADEKLCIKLLAGWDVDQGNKQATTFPAPDSQEERDARTALARRVRDRMSGFSGELLALAIDPYTPSSWPNLPGAIRWIEFKNPGRGNPSTWVRDRLVIDFVRGWLRKRPGKEQAALRAAAEEFEIGDTRAHQIWKAYKNLIGW